MKKKKRRLTEKQKRFCDYYIETGNATESYKRAGYKVRTDGAARSNASRLLTKANIKFYIDKRLEEIENQRIADAKEVLEYLTRVLRGQEEETVVVGTELGVERVKKEPNIRERNKAAELLGKRYSLFTDRVDLDGDVTVQIIDDIEADADDED